MYIMVSILGKLEGVRLHSMKLGKGIESPRETLGLWDSDRKSFFKPSLSSAPLRHQGEQGRAARGSCLGQVCIMIEEMCYLCRNN